MEKDEFKDISINEALEKLNSNIKGLSEQEAAKNIEKYGYNEIREEKENYPLMFLKKFAGPVPLLLIVVIVISYILRNFNDMYIILALLFFNTIIAFYEEYRADLSIQALKQRLRSNARVLRSGSWKEVSSRDIVPGDIIRIRFGDIIPADVKIIDCDYLEIDESVITGESLPIAKKESEVAYAGAVVKVGEATCLVVRTREGTSYGRIATLMESAKPKHHLQGTIMHIVKYLVLIDIAIIVILFGYGVLGLHAGIAGLLQFLLIVFLASVPVALPSAFTVAMALGTEKLQKRSVLVRKLDAVEDTATMDVLCMDKTGTLTKNLIVVKELVAFDSKKDADVIRYAAEASREEDKDPIDNAILNYAKKIRVKRGNQIKFTPFDMSTKRTEAIIKNGNSEYKVIKGAVVVVLELCKSKRGEKEKITKLVADYAKKGYRSLGVAVDSGRGFKLIGIIALYDEPREDAAELIKELNGMGVETKMLTGDNIAVAIETASSLGLKGEIIDMSTLNKNDKKIYSVISKAGGFANIYPEDKYTIVKALQSHKKITGMTGDGINDAPALKEAEVGIAVSNATDVAKSAAAMVITEKGIEVIIEAVKESRRIFERMLTYAMTKIYRVVQTVGFIAILFLGMHGFIGITPFLLILLLFTNDIANITIATDNVAYSMSPDIWKVKAVMYTMVLLGGVMIFEMLLLVPLKLALGLTLLQFQTCAFLLLDISNKFGIFNMRTKKLFWRAPKPSIALLVGSAAGVVAGLVFAFFGILVPKVGVEPILAVIGISVLFLFIVDFIKVALFKRFKIE